MKLETERLLIFPLTQDQLILYMQGNNKLDEALNLKKSNQISISQELPEAFNEMLLPLTGIDTRR